MKVNFSKCHNVALIASVSIYCILTGHSYGPNARNKHKVDSTGPIEYNNICVYLRSILQARQLVFLSKVCIWKLCWLAVALSGLMLDLEDKKQNKKFIQKNVQIFNSFFKSKSKFSKL